MFDETTMTKTEARVAELRRLATANGGLLQPEQVVEAARDPKSALHDWFTWDDSEAAALYRLEQARALLRVRVRYTHAETTTVVPAFVSLDSDRARQGGYKDFRGVIADADLRLELLQTAKRELTMMARRYRSLKELAEVIEAIDDLD